MFNIIKKEINWGGRTLSFETGRIARQADGSVLVTYGETMVLATIVYNKKLNPNNDFFPLTCSYVEKSYAAGKIPGGFFKREGRPSEKEVLTSRLMDRPLRPLFADDFYHETQIVCTVLSHDKENDPDVVAMVAAAAATAISGAPIIDIMAACRVAFIDGQYVLNPTPDQLQNSQLDLVVAGTSDSVMMVESEAKELSEKVMLDAVIHGHEEMQSVIAMIKEFAAEVNHAPFEYQKHEEPKDLYKELKKEFNSGFEKAYKILEKQDRSKTLDALRDKIKVHFAEREIESMLLDGLTKKLEKDIVRGNILKTGSRIDGRDTKTVRQIVPMVDVLPKTHGSALFTRGETQALVALTLGTSQDEQIIDALVDEYKESFMLHYNFPPFSVGEATPLRAPGRREIGHGKLAWRAIHPMLPSKEEFPYTIRVVSEIMESNGSSSMATVCGTSLALMDAGVPLKKPVAGIAMGLIKEGKDYAVLSDILGDEDHLGDMDFKVAGTADGITALQMDIKIAGITSDIMSDALHQALDGRIHILGKMAEALSAPRAGLNKNAPTITTIKIHKDKIREVIGSGGKVIREICEVSGAKVDIEDDGTVKIAAVDQTSGDKALEMIRAITQEPEINTIYLGKVVKVVDFGAFVRYFGTKEGLVHVSEISDERINNVSDVLKEGDEVKVLLYDVDRTGKVKLSIRAVDQTTGDLIEGYTPKSSSSDRSRSDKPERSDRPERGGNRDSRDRDRKTSGPRRPQRSSDSQSPRPNRDAPSQDDGNRKPETKDKRKYFF